MLAMSVNLQGVQTARINGFVTDGRTGEVLIGANVFLLETGEGMATDRNGYYVLDGISPGGYTLVVSYLGYDDYREGFSLSESEIVSRDIALQPVVLEAEEVVVEGEKIKRKMTIQPGRVNLGPRQIKSYPALAEPDIFRTLQSLPGVLTPSEFSTGLIIRGGNTDQNLILLDGITVYNPSHLGGVFSNFIVDAVKEADLIKGGYNAEYGGRLSAVLNVLSREGNRNRFDAKTSISLLSAQTTVEGPFPNGAWLLAGRRTYFDKVFANPKIKKALGDPNIPNYYFYDLQGHVFTDISDRDRLSLSFYGGLDDLDYSDFGLDSDWGNETVSLAYRRLFSDLLIGNFLLAKSRFFTVFDLGGITTDNSIDDITASADLTYFQSKNLTFKFGGQVKQLGFMFDSAWNDSTVFELKETPYEAALYAKGKWSASQRLIIEPGVRLNGYTNTTQTLFPDLRLGVKYLLTDDRYINFALGNYHQFIVTMQDDFNPTVLDTWMAVDESVEPAAAQQVVLGYEEYIRNAYRIQVEGYAKWIQNTLTYVEARASVDETVSDVKVSDNFYSGDGYAYGLELFLQKRTGRLNGWLAYTYSVSRKKLLGEEYFNNWDRRHAFNLIGSYNFGKGWEFNWKWTYQSGQAFTPILGWYSQDLGITIDSAVPSIRTIPGTRNGGRYPPFHRLDMGLVKKLKIANFESELYLQVINGYNRKNVFRYFYDIGSSRNGIDDDGDWDVTKHDLGMDGLSGTGDTGEGDGKPTVGEPNVDELDEGRIRRQDISIFPLIPSIGITVAF